MRNERPEDAHVTVVVMTRNRWPDLRASLPRHQAPVVVVDNGSTDGTPAKVRAHFPELEVIALPKNLGAVARNIGVSRARTPTSRSPTMTTGGRQAPWSRQPA